MTRGLKLHYFHFLPNMITLFNLFTGFVSLIMAAHGHFKVACWLVVLSLVWDSLDGNIARIFRNTSQLGKEIDSLADLVSFVVSPVFILAAVFSKELNNAILLALFFYLGTGALRLAIFNISGSSAKESFTGLPTPAAALVLNAATLASIHNEWTGAVFFSWGICLLIVLLGFLMVSKIRYPKLSVIKFSKWKSLLYLGLTCSSAVFFLVNFETSLAALGLFFLLAAPGYCLPELENPAGSQAQEG